MAPGGSRGASWKGGHEELPWPGFQGAGKAPAFAKKLSSPSRRFLPSLKYTPAHHERPSKKQLPEAMTCPCSRRPSGEGRRGLRGPALRADEGRERLAPSNTPQVHSPLTLKANTLLHPCYCP
ncbi:spermatogenesis-associated protein 8-like [Herpailurus yagouaroundi]|uniref:spermatogenesis-associated protein 8-like n=1 Tax=Herpailurus yagouaroundi TaxID=1608482 RepID=UPI001AD7441C|nr:spermatogenesis-associated protein 8-like [Puma yagouaroundi]